MTAKASARIEFSADAFAVHNTSSSPTMTNVTASSEIAGDSSYGIWNEGDSDPYIRDSVVSAAAGGSQLGEASNTAALASVGSSVLVRVESSELTGGDAIIGFSGATTRVGASRLTGSVVIDGGATVKCVASYSGNFDPLSATCA